MKRIGLVPVIFSLLCATAAYAQTVENDLVGLGMSPEQAEYLAGIIPAGAALDNNVYLKADNQAGSAQINVLKVDTSDDTILNADTGDVIKFAINGTTELQVSDDTLTYAGTNAFIYSAASQLTYLPASDLNRRFTFAATSDVNHYLWFGDGGSTADQSLWIQGPNADGDDDYYMVLGSTTDRAGQVSVFGNEHSGSPGNVKIKVGNAANAYLYIVTSDGATDRTRWSMARGSGSLVGDATYGGDIVYSAPGAGPAFPATNYEAAAAAGNSQGTAADLTATRVHYITDADGTKGVQFAAVAAGDIGKAHFLLTSAAAVLKIYPESTGTINGAAADAAYSTGTGPLTVMCLVTAAKTWVCG